VSWSWCLKIGSGYYCGETGSFLHERAQVDASQRMALRWSDRNIAVHNALAINNGRISTSHTEENESDSRKEEP
jgi:hypothetical protein